MSRHRTKTPRRRGPTPAQVRAQLDQYAVALVQLSQQTQELTRHVLAMAEELKRLRRYALRQEDPHVLEDR